MTRHGPAQAVRDDDVTTTPDRTCPTCGTMFRRAGRRRFCSHACRQADYRARRQTPPPPAPQRTATVYECPTCEQRYLGDQRCPDCNIYCRRLGTGGPCPHCDELITADDLTA